ncbi:unnamed protein product [Paramecium primaurelia]|uniref:Uncharacterized protein n=1 Tax=Paramecium primaurelia TaxID=5886 RepID=A0A8S1NZ89_PARPR|nr:unnamed protein product [Paramecium primaurelia]
MLATVQNNEVFQGKNKINAIEITIKIINKVFQLMYQYNYQFNLIGSKIKIHLIYLEFNALMTINKNFYNSFELINLGTFRDFIKCISYNQESQYKGLCFIQDNLEENLKLKIFDYMILYQQQLAIKLINFETTLLFKGIEIYAEESEINFCRSSIFF